MWGVFEERDTVHVSPVRNDGTKMAPHTLTDICVCRPEIEMVEGSEKLLIIHREVH